MKYLGQKVVFIVVVCFLNACGSETKTPNLRSSDTNVQDTKDFGRVQDLGHKDVLFTDLPHKTLSINIELRPTYKTRLQRFFAGKEKGILQHTLSISFCEFVAPERPDEKCSKYREMISETQNEESKTFEKASSLRKSYYISKQDSEKASTFDVLIFANNYEGYVYAWYELLKTVDVELLPKFTIETPKAVRRALVYGHDTIKDNSLQDYESLFQKMSQARLNQLVVGLVAPQIGIPLPSDIRVSDAKNLSLVDKIYESGLFVQDKNNLGTIIDLAAAYGIDFIPAVEHPGKLFKSLFPESEYPQCYAANRRSLRWGCSEIRELMKVFIFKILDLSSSKVISVWNDEGGVLDYAVRDYMNMVDDIIREYQKKRPVKLRYLTTESTRLAFGSEVLPDLQKMSASISSVDLYDGYNYTQGNDHKSVYNLLNYQTSPVMIKKFRAKQVPINLFSTIDRSQWFGVPVSYVDYMKQVASFIDLYCADENCEMGMSSYVSGFIDDAYLFLFSETSWSGGAFQYVPKDQKKFEGVDKPNELFEKIERVKKNFLHLNQQMFRVVNTQEAKKYLGAIGEIDAVKLGQLKSDIHTLNTEYLSSVKSPVLKFEMEVLEYSIESFLRLLLLREVCRSGDNVKRLRIKMIARDEAQAFFAKIATAGIARTKYGREFYWENPNKIKLPYYFMLKKGERDLFSSCP